MKEAYIVSMGRSGIAKATKNGSLINENPVQISANVLKNIINKTPNLKEGDIEDVIVGCAFPEADQGMNIGRLIAQEAGLPNSVPGQTVNRFCSSGLQSISMAANSIICGEMDVVIAGGLEFMSAIPMGGTSLIPVPNLINNYPESYVTMGITAENIASRFNITRKLQDDFSVKSHKKLFLAQKKGLFEKEIIPLKVKNRIFKIDEGIRPDSSVESLSKLRSPFKKGGTVTAGNSSQISDGTGFLLLMSKEKIEELNIVPIAKFVSFSVVGVDPEYMGLGPIKAIPQALYKANLTIDDIDLFELNEAFASQAIACIQELKLPENKVNVNGGAIAHGHPLGATGSILTIKLLAEMQRRSSNYGVVSMCIGGGMGAAGVFQLLKKS